MANPETMAAVIGGHLVLNAVVGELVALLTPEQQALLRERLKEHADSIGPIDEYEPECSEFQRARFAMWDTLLDPGSNEPQLALISTDGARPSDPTTLEVKRPRC